jgi:Ring finger domain
MMMMTIPLVTEPSATTGLLVLLWAVLRLYVTTLICLVPLSVCLLYSLLRLIKCDDASEASLLCSLAGCAFYGIIISTLWREDMESSTPSSSPLGKPSASPIALKVYTVVSSLVAPEVTGLRVLPDESDDVDDNDDKERTSGGGEGPEHTRQWNDLTSMAPCSICLYGYRVGETVSMGEQCLHTFHASCIVQWTNRHHTSCPCCRQHLLQLSSRPQPKQPQFSLLWSVWDDVRQSLGMS